MDRNEAHDNLIKAVGEAVKAAREAELEVYVDVRAFSHDENDPWFRVNDFTTEG